ncbi:TolC family protein [Paenibacillus massiliensis]|uniref:TolC family protein n=1 Tax=Paenibacillus massiliensis TaxID=225917 RepID=UPI00035E9406|nr:TolC family protein [Paenibacillus massiliensis]
MKHQPAAAVLLLSLSAVLSMPSAAGAAVISTPIAPSGTGAAQGTLSSTNAVTPAFTAETSQSANRNANASASAKQQELTLEQANAWAQANSFTLKTSAQDLERKNLELKKSIDALGYIQQPSSLEESDSSANNSAWKAYTSANLSYLSAKKQGEFEKDKVYAQVMKAYYRIFTAENQVLVAQESVQIAKLEERVAIAKLARGLISEKSKIDSTKARSDAELTLEQRKTDLQKAKDELNTLMNKPKGTEFTLISHPVYHEPEPMNVETHITGLLKDNPTIWQLQDAVKNAEISLRYYNFQGTAEDYDLVKLDLKNANEALSNGKDNFAESVRSLYTTLQDEQKKYAQLHEDLAIAEANLVLARKKWERGLIIELELIKARLSVEQLKQQINDLAIGLIQSNYTLNKPWSS